LSLYASGNTVGISTAAAEVLGAEEGDYLHVSLDRTRTAWVSVIEERTDQKEPEIRVHEYDGEGRHVLAHSTITVTHLRSAYDLSEGESHRLHITGETETHPEHGITLYEIRP
jgi:hypothetical protein